MTSPPVRILWLHSHFQLPTGGTKYIFEVARRLAQDLPLEVVVESASPLWRERYAEAGVTLSEVGGLTSTSLAYWAAFPIFLRRDLRFVRARLTQDTVVISSFFPMPWIAWRAVRTSGLRHVSLCFEPFPFFHDSEVIGLYPRWKRTLLRGLARAYGWVDRSGIHHADAVLTLNQATDRQIERVYDRHGAVLAYAGVDTELFRPYTAEELDDLVARFGSAPLVIHSTDYSPIKRTDLALRAFAVAQAEVPGSRLVVTSTRKDPAAERDLRQQAVALGIAEHVTFAGFLPFEDLPRLYSLATCLLQTGTSSGSGATTMSLPVKEALACGTPVVRSEATGEDVEDGVSGFLVDPRDVINTGRQLAALLGDPEEAASMGMVGRERIVRTYTWPGVAAVFRNAVLS